MKSSEVSVVWQSYFQVHVSVKFLSIRLGFTQLIRILKITILRPMFSLKFVTTYIMLLLVDSLRVRLL